MAETKTDRVAWPPQAPAPAAPQRTSARRAFHPFPPVLSFEAYGVRVEFAEDFLIAEGHISTQRFAAATNKVARRDLGLVNAWDDLHASFEDFASGVRHVWAFRLPKCDCTPDELNEYGACESLDDHDVDPEPTFWRISWGSAAEPVTADTPGAKPYTIGRW